MAKIQIGDIEFFYQDCGEGKPLLLFVHGWGASSRFWKYALPQLSQRFRCVAFDLPGFGDSGTPTNSDYSVAALATFMQNFMDALSIKSAVIVAHSMGGCISLRFALENQHRVQGLVLVSPIVDGATAFSLRQRFLLFPLMRMLIYGLLRLRTFRRYFAKKVVHRPLEDELMDDLARANYHAMFRSAISMRRTNLINELHKLIHIPTLIIASPFDAVVPFEQNEALTRHLKQARLERFENSIHCPMLEEPDHFATALLEFVSTLSTSTPNSNNSSCV